MLFTISWIKGWNLSYLYDNFSHFPVHFHIDNLRTAFYYVSFLNSDATIAVMPLFPYIYIRIYISWPRRCLVHIYFGSHDCVFGKLSAMKPMNGQSFDCKNWYDNAGCCSIEKTRQRRSILLRRIRNCYRIGNVSGYPNDLILLFFFFVKVKFSMNEYIGKFFY